jgi:hypothetical protein
MYLWVFPVGQKEGMSYTAPSSINTLVFLCGYRSRMTLVVEGQ